MAKIEPSCQASGSILAIKKEANQVGVRGRVHQWETTSSTSFCTNSTLVPYTTYGSLFVGWPPSSSFHFQLLSSLFHFLSKSHKNFLQFRAQFQHPKVGIPSLLFVFLELGLNQLSLPLMISGFMLGEGEGLVLILHEYDKLSWDWIRNLGDT